MKHCFLSIFLIYISLFFFLLSCTQSKVNTTDFDAAMGTTDSLMIYSPKKTIRILDSLKLHYSDISEEQEALLLFKKGEVYYVNDLYLEAIQEHQKAYTLFSKQKDNYNKTRSLITLSAANLRFENVEKSQEYALEALHEATLLSDKRLLAKANNLLFQLHFTLEDYSKALDYIQKAEKIFTDEKDTVSALAIKSNIAAVYLKQKNYQKALAVYKESLDLGKNINAPQTIVKILNNIGFTYIEVKEYAFAIQFFESAIDLNKNIDAINAAPYKGLGYVYFLNNDFKKAITNYNVALVIYKQNKNLPEQIEILDKLITLTIQEKNPQHALMYQAERDQLQVALQTIEKERLLHFSTIKYKAKEKEIALQYEQQTNKKNRWLFGSLLLILTLLLFLLGSYLYITKLKAANKASQLEQSLLRVQMNPHFIFNTLAAIQNITLENSPIKASNYIAKFSKLIRQNFDYVQKEEITLEQEINMISNYIETQQFRFQYSFQYVLTLSQNCNSQSIKVPPMLLQPFVENAIEYGLKEKKEDGLLEINIDKEGNQLCFEIKDNGIGRSNEAKQYKKNGVLHATEIFIERLKLRKKSEEETFQIIDLYDLENKPVGTKIVFKIYIK
ncbi:tetratricopeptide repeat protein [Flavobacterium sp.]|uniref:tetratricopeptide repeat protein n=1 Tax=Flavobacterium sp. TaxID=239 RepID=UPI0040475028